MADKKTFEKRTKLEIDQEKKLLALEQERWELKEKRFNIENTIIDKRTKAYRDAKKANTEDQRDTAKAISAEKKRDEILSGTRKQAAGAADQAKKIGDNITKFVEDMPGGGFLVEALGLKGLGDRMKKQLISKIQQSTLATKGLGVAMKLAMGPIGIGLIVFTAIFTIIKKVRGEARDLAENLNTSTSQAMKMLPALKMQEFKFKMMGLDSAKIKTTLSAITDEFGSMENVTVKNAANISRMAQNLGTSGKEVVQFNKVMMDLTGASFDTATNMAQVAANMAKSANVATGRVLNDMASNAEDFARFSMQGADGMAKAAIEAAKIGGSLSTILKSADALLDFESSITAQFKAQVLTGKMINTERARQLALDGDIAGLTTEIQSIVGGVGDIQALNVLQRKSVADSIGISVGELMKISRGEQAQQQETVQDKLNVTNKLLARSLDISQSQLDELIKPTTLSPNLF